MSSVKRRAGNRLRKACRVYVPLANARRFRDLGRWTLSALLGGRNGYLVLALAISLGVLLVTHPEYFTLDNLRVIALNQSSVGIGAVGMAFLIVAGQIDLSIGSIFMASSMPAAFLTLRVPAPVAVVGALALGSFLGLIN